MSITFISAGAGSGKTYRLTEILHTRLTSGAVRPSGVIATTFTVKAANELRERARAFLMAHGAFALATSLDQARIGTVNSVCSDLLRRFAFEAGLPTEQQVLGEAQAPLLLAHSIDAVRDGPQLQALIDVADRLGIDWQPNLKKLVDLVRASGIDPSLLPAMAHENAAALIRVFPKVADGNLDAELVSAIDAAEPALRAALEAKPKRNTDEYLQLCREVRARLAQQRCPWSQWAKLSKMSPEKALETAVQLIGATAERHAEHPRLHEDVRSYLLKLFALCQAALEDYAERKRVLGLVDFVDQEHLLLKALDHPEVRSALRDELDLLLVDEFQDTSPIQLAVFLKLAGLAREVVWVGDVKQAIYGFRGSDTALMQAVLDALPKLGGRTDLLDVSRRSRPSLVSLVNAVFVPAFQPKLTAEQVALRPTRPEPETGAAFANWLLGRGNVSQQIDALSAGIGRLVASPYEVVDRKTKEKRAARYGDIAVLVRANDRVEGVAAGLTARGIPAATAQPGLLRKPEIVLAIACLRRLNDAQDTVATAEILSLAECQEPEVWLEDRLAYLRAGGKPAEWREAGGNAHALIARMARLRAQLPVLAPREAVELVIAHGDLPRLVLQWSRTEEIARARLANLEALMDLSCTYEDECNGARTPATVSGLLAWLQQQAGDGHDWLPEPELDAVKVLTYHGAKGLEWPIVILMDLHMELKHRLWDLTAQSRRALDFAEPLKDRFIHYWPWPYGRQRNVQVANHIAQMRTARDFHEASVDEAKRLLYVGMTRARDLLIFARSSSKPSGEWLKSVNAPWLLPGEAAEALTLPDGTCVPYQHWELAPPSTEPAPVRTETTLYWFSPIGERSARLPLRVSPSGAAPVSCNVLESVQIGERITLASNADMQRIGSAIHNCIAAATVAWPRNLSAEEVAAILSAWGIADSPAPHAIVAQLQALHDWLHQRWPNARLHCEIPVEACFDNGQVLKGQIDLLLETESGWVLIDHKSHPGGANTWKSTADRHSGQLKLYKEGVERATGRAVLETWLYFPVAAGAVRIEVSEQLCAPHKEQQRCLGDSADVAPLLSQ